MSSLFSQALAGSGSGGGSAAAAPPATQAPASGAPPSSGASDAGGTEAGGEEAAGAGDDGSGELVEQAENVTEGAEAGAEAEAAGEGEATGEGEEGVGQVADAALKAGSFKPDPKLLADKIAALNKAFPGVGKEHEMAIKKMANQELYIQDLQSKVGEGRPDPLTEGDGLTDYERELGLGKQPEPQKELKHERDPPPASQPLQAVAPSIYEQAFGRDYNSRDEELAMERELSDKFTEGKASYNDIRTVQEQRVRRQLYKDPMTRAVMNKIIAEELEGAGISPLALREVSTNTFQTMDWSFAIRQQSIVKGFEDLQELSKVSSPELIQMPDGRQVPDSPLNRLMLANWDQVKDINVVGANPRQTSIRTNLSRLRILHKIHKQQQANSKMAKSAVQTGLEAGKNAAGAQAKARLNGGGKTAAPGNSKTGFGGQTEEPYSARFLKDRGTKFSSL